MSEYCHDCGTTISDDIETLCPTCKKATGAVVECEMCGTPEMKYRKKLDETPCSPKIIQILIAPNDSTWQGILLGLGDDGITYQVGTGTKWEPMIPPINSEESD